MLLKLEKTDKDHLDHVKFQGDPDVVKAADLLYEIIDDSFQSAGDCLEMEVNGGKESLRSLYWKCKDLLKQSEKGGEKTVFLSMSILEHTFNLCSPLLLVRIEDLIAQDGKQIKRVKQIQKIFQDNPYKILWTQKADQYRSIMERMGFTVQTDAYKDLTAIVDPLLDAFTFYQGRNHQCPPAIYKIRDGKVSAKRPEMSSTICKYSSEKELVDALVGCGKESAMAFGAIEKTSRMMDDGFYKWFYGFPPERQRNVMAHDHITEEEYLDQICDYTRCVYLCVKSAETIWLVEMPYKTNYHRFDDASSKYYYGRRAGYAPHEVFYKESPAAPVDSTFLAIPQKGWKLAEIMDDEQKVWLPVFLEETYEKFYKTEPKADRWYLPQELAAELPVAAPDAKKQYIVPVIPSLPCRASAFIYHVRTPEEVFADIPQMLTLLSLFQISGSDLAGVPMLSAECLTEKEIRKCMEEREKRAYVKLLADKICALLEGRFDVRNKLVDFMQDQENEIIDRALKGEFDSFTSVLIDGAPELDRNGNPVMRNKNGWSNEKVQEKVRTSKDDGRNYPWSSLKQPRFFRTQAIWLGKVTASGKPPVLWQIRPKSAEDYAIFLKTEKKDLPLMLRYLDELKWFEQEYRNLLPNKYSYPGPDQTGILVPQFVKLNLCMTKKVYDELRKLN